VFKALTQGAEKYKVLVHHVILLSNTTTLSLPPPKRIFTGSCPANGGIRYNKLTGRSGHLWGDRYRSCIIDTDEYYLACVRYIYRNPKRAGMVKDLEEFADSTNVKGR
jgi:putative transposase